MRTYEVLYNVSSGAYSLIYRDDYGGPIYYLTGTTFDNEGDALFYAEARNAQNYKGES